MGMTAYERVVETGKACTQTERWNDYMIHEFFMMIILQLHDCPRVVMACTAGVRLGQVLEAGRPEAASVAARLGRP
jgi:hypothetical protein